MGWSNFLPHRTLTFCSTPSRLPIRWREAKSCPPLCTTETDDKLWALYWINLKLQGVHCDEAKHGRKFEINIILSPKIFKKINGKKNLTTASLSRRQNQRAPLTEQGLSISPNRHGLILPSFSSPSPPYSQFLELWKPDSAPFSVPRLQLPLRFKSHSTVYYPKWLELGFPWEMAGQSVFLSRVLEEGKGRAGPQGRASRRHRSSRSRGWGFPRRPGESRSGLDLSLKNCFPETFSPLILFLVDQIARKLEAANPTKEPLKSPLLNGKWELIYTTSQSILQTKVYQLFSLVYAVVGTPLFISICKDDVINETLTAWRYTVFP